MDVIQVINSVNNRNLFCDIRDALIRTFRFAIFNSKVQYWRKKQNTFRMWLWLTNDQLMCFIINDSHFATFQWSSLTQLIAIIIPISGIQLSMHYFIVECITNISHYTNFTIIESLYMQTECQIMKHSMNILRKNCLSVLIWVQSFHPYIPLIVYIFTLQSNSYLYCNYKSLRYDSRNWQKHYKIEINCAQEAHEEKIAICMINC